MIASEAAQRRGIRTGMKLSAAHALANNLCVRTRDAAAEHAALTRLAAWAGQFTPAVSLAPEALLLEIEGSLALFGNLAALLGRVHEGIEALGYRAQPAVAPTPLAAEWLARAQPGAVIADATKLASRLAPLPLGGTGLAPATIALLDNMGVRTLGDLLRLPRAGLARRLGAETVHRLDRALGRAPDPREPYVPPETFEARLPLPGAVENTEGLSFPLKRLLLELCGFLTARGAGAQAIALALHHPRAAATEVRLALTAPTRDARHLGELYRERLARSALPEPVEALTLRVPQIFSLHARNLDFFNPRHTPAEAGAALIERLRARLGREAVQGLSPVAEHRPERAWRYAAPGAAGAEARFPPRPLWLLPEPVALEVSNDGAPQLDGPLALLPERERIESGWWDGGEIARDYCIARNDRGAQFWIFRELAGERRWWLHGVFG